MTHKQQEQFVQFYQRLYGDTSVKTGTGKLPTIFKDEEEMHINMRKLELTKILGKTKANKSYYHRGGRKEKYVDYVFSWLWLGYGPIVLDYDKTIMRKNNMINCQRCGKEIQGYGGNRKYCSKCRIEVDKELRQKKK